jgi:DNA-binding response OmpR family regulator
MATMNPKRRMLIVEDDLDTRRALRGIFKVLGWEVSEARRASEAMSQLDPAPDMMILDLKLPDGRGETVLKRVREKRLKTRVAVCTGIFDRGRLTDVWEMKPDAILQKPIDAVELYCVCES